MYESDRHQKNVEILENLPGIEVTEHAVDQFIARSGTKQSREKIYRKLKLMYGKANEVRKKDATMSLLNNNIKPARYFERMGWILVVVDEKITTCYKAKLANFEPTSPQSL